MHSRRVLVLAACLVALTNSGCAELLSLLRGGVRTPVATYQKVELASITLDDATVAATFQIDNPNPIGLSLAGIGYAFSLDGRRLFDGQLPNGLQLPPNGRMTLVVPVKVPFSALPDLATTFATRTEAPYTVAASATVRTPIGELTLPLSWTGKLPIPHLPKLSVGSARVENLSFLGARLVVTLAVDNPNGFELPLSSLTGHVLVAGQQIAALGLAASRPLAAGRVTMVELPIDLSFASAGLAVSAALAQGRAAVRLQGAASIAGRMLPLDLATTLQ